MKKSINTEPGALKTFGAELILGIFGMAILAFINAMVTVARVMVFWDDVKKKFTCRKTSTQERK